MRTLEDVQAMAIRAREKLQNKDRSRIREENKKDHCYISYINENYSTWGYGYSIYGTIGRRAYHECTLKEAMERYNQEAKASA